MPATQVRRETLGPPRGRDLSILWIEVDFLRYAWSRDVDLKIPREEKKKEHQIEFYISVDFLYSP